MMAYRLVHTALDHQSEQKHVLWYSEVGKKLAAMSVLLQEDAAFNFDLVRNETSILGLLKRCRRSDGIAREK